MVQRRTEEGQYVEPGFGRVADAFFDTLTEPERSGAAVAVYVDGHLVASLHGGTSDARTGRPFGADAVVPVFSATKGLSSVLVAMLIERGDLPPYDTPVGLVWPAFEAHGKADVSIGDVLAHRAGVSAPVRDLTEDELLNPLAMADALRRSRRSGPPARPTSTTRSRMVRSQPNSSRSVRDSPSDSSCRGRQPGRSTRMSGSGCRTRCQTGSPFSWPPPKGNPQNRHRTRTGPIAQRRSGGFRPHAHE